MDQSSYDKEVLSAAAAENLDYEHIPVPENVTAGADKELIQHNLAGRAQMIDVSADNVERVFLAKEQPASNVKKTPRYGLAA